MAVVGASVIAVALITACTVAELRDWPWRDIFFVQMSRRRCSACGGSGYCTEQRPMMQIAPGNFVNGDKIRKCGCR